MTQMAQWIDMIQAGPVQTLSGARLGQYRASQDPVRSHSGPIAVRSQSGPKAVRSQVRLGTQYSARPGWGPITVLGQDRYPYTTLLPVHHPANPGTPFHPGTHLPPTCHPEVYVHVHVQPCHAHSGAPG